LENLAPSSKTVGSLLRTPRLAKLAEKKDSPEKMDVAEKWKNGFTRKMDLAEKWIYQKNGFTRKMDLPEKWIWQS
jgi:hypothetical protein